MALFAPGVAWAGHPLKDEVQRDRAISRQMPNEANNLKIVRSDVCGSTLQTFLSAVFFFSDRLVAYPSSNRYQ